MENNNTNNNKINITKQKNGYIKVKTSVFIKTIIILIVGAIMLGVSIQGIFSIVQISKLKAESKNCNDTLNATQDVVNNIYGIDLDINSILDTYNKGKTYNN